MPEQNDHATSQDVENHYRVILGRRPESDKVIAEMTGSELGGLLAGFISSGEFMEGVFTPIAAGQPIELHRFTEPLEDRLREWAAERLARGIGADQARAANGSIALLIALFRDGALIADYGSSEMIEQLSAFQAGLDLLAAPMTAAIHSVDIEKQSRALDLLVEKSARAGEEEPVLVADLAMVRESLLFDPDYYARTVGVLPKGMEPAEHYLRHGWKHYVATSAAFDGIDYLARCPEARSGGTPPLLHHLHNPAMCPPDKNSDTRWVGGIDYTDSNVHVERLRAASFFFRYNLGAIGEDALTHVDDAVRDLAARTPAWYAVETPPRVSIIIPIYGQLPFVLHCLDSLVRHRTRFSCEVILFDDASPEEAQIGVLRDIPWARYVHGGQNRGFVGACNHAVQQSEGDYVVLLNSDTRVCDGWLDELIGTFEARPQAGLLGSKLYFADGGLQESGAIVWEDGSAWNFGRGDHPGRSQYSYARQVDYCSGAAIALPRDLWNELGGFDTHYAPAYYEDVDIAFRVRAAGREVWLQPLARVIHYEGITHGRDTSKGVKAMQVVNAAKFFERWRKDISEFGRPGEHPLRMADRTAPRRMLAMDALTPTPDRDAGSVMTARLLEIYQRLGWHVTFAPMHDPRFDPRYSADLQRAGIEVMTGSAGFGIDQLLLERGPDYYEAVLGFRVTVLASLADRIRALVPSALLMFHDIDLHYLRLQREAALSGSRHLAREVEVMQDCEYQLIAKVDCTIVPSTVEKDLIEQELGVSSTVVYSYTADVHPSEEAWDDRRHLVFIGGFRHSPNVDAMRVFITEAWPELKRRLPDDVRLYVIGADAPQELHVHADDRVVFTGFVEDLGPTLATCRVFVAPLRFGAGLKGKVVTSLSYGVPCVASAIAIEGMNLDPEREVLEANDSAGFVDQVTRLYDDQALWRRLRSAGHAFVQAQYGWETGIEVVNQILNVAEKTWLDRRRQARAEWLDSLKV